MKDGHSRVQCAAESSETSCVVDVSIRSLLPPDLAVPMVAARDIGRAAAAVLTRVIGTAEYRVGG